MIDKVRKGDRVAGLLYYLYGPGNGIRTWSLAGAPWPRLSRRSGPTGRGDFRDLVNQLNAPLDALGRKDEKNTVWQCVLSAAPEDPLLSDEQWKARAARIAAEQLTTIRQDPALRPQPSPRQAAAEAATTTAMASRPRTRPAKRGRS